MEFIYGKSTGELDRAGLLALVSDYREVVIDIGTGDGRFGYRAALDCPSRFVIGLDACRENLRDISGRPLPNLLYLIANAETLPPELSRMADLITINFPWGSLLEGLLHCDSAVIQGLGRVTKPTARLEIRLNQSALLPTGLSFEQAVAKIRPALRAAGFEAQPPIMLNAAALRVFPTTWAKRMAYGRDPQALFIKGCKKL